MIPGIVAGHAITVAPPGSTLRDLILGRSPLAYWPLDDVSGSTMTDDSGNGRNGTYGVGVTLGEPSLVTDPGASINLTGGALCLVGQASWQNVSQLGLLLVYKPIVTNANQHIIDKDSGGTTGWWVRQNVDRTLEFSLLSSAGRLTANTGAFTTSDGVAHIIEAGYDGTTIKIYVDGVLRGSGTNPSTITNSAQPINFGRNSSAGLIYQGGLQHVAMFNASPTDEQALASAEAAGFA